MKSTWSEETRMSVLDHYLVDPNVSMLAKRLTRNGKDCAIPIHGFISLRLPRRRELPPRFPPSRLSDACLRAPPRVCVWQASENP